MTLSFHYDKDWRFQALVFRVSPGVSAVTNQTRRAAILRAALALVFAASTALLLKIGSLWMAGVIGLMTAYYLLDLAFKVWTFDHLARHVLRQLARGWRRKAPRSVSLTFDEDGIREIDGGIESRCPWAEVLSFSRSQGLISIALGNGQLAWVPTVRLSAGSSSARDLVTLLEQRGIRAS